jgi:PEP-CTERM motif-containing protein
MKVLQICVVFVLLLAPVQASYGAVIDDFESYAVGLLPSPLWKDAGAVLPVGRIPPFPSGYVISTTDAFGAATKAVTTVGDLATSKGIYADVPISTFYSLHADVRVDRYSDAPDSTVSDWAMQVTFGENGVDNWAYTPQAGIYASSLTQGWRLYVATVSAFADIDLGVAATVGTWYTVSQDFDVLTGLFHSRIVDTASGTVLVDQLNLIDGWVPADAKFDAFAFFGGDLGQGDTIGNIGVIDNVNVVATPEPSSLALVAIGLAMLVARRRRI